MESILDGQILSFRTELKVEARPQQKRSGPRRPIKTKWETLGARGERESDLERYSLKSTTPSDAAVRP